MSFKKWYHEQYLSEDLERREGVREVVTDLDPEVEEMQRETPADKLKQDDEPSVNFGFYFKDGQMKSSLQRLGKDLGDSLYDFAINKYVNADMFDSEDNKLKYETEVRNKLAEDYNEKLTEILRNAGIFLANAKEKYTK